MNESKLNYTCAITLALAFLTSWEEDHRKEPGQKIRRCWKEFLFVIMDELEQRGYVRASKASRSFQITDAGTEIGKDLSEHLRQAFAAWIAK